MYIGTEYMGGTALHEHQDSCPLGATIQVESVWNKLHILSQDSNLEAGRHGGREGMEEVVP